MIIRNCICGLAVVLALFVFDASASAQEKAEKAETSPVAGSWKFEREALSGNVKCQLRFTEKDGKIQGSYSDAEDVKAKVGDITVKDGEVTIKLIFDNDGKKSRVTLSGKLDGDTIVGTLADGDDEQKWKAIRFVSLQDAVGNWRMSFTTPDGTERNPEFVLKQDDGEPELTFESGSGEAGDSKISNVKFKDGLLIFDVALDFQGQDLSLEYELEFISSDELEGSMFFEFEAMDQSGDVDVEGERIK